jgi:hypothetical protein
MAFDSPEDLTTVREIGANALYGTKAMCANNKQPVAGTVCCDANGNNPQNICVFKGERATFATSKDRCSAYKKKLPSESFHRSGHLVSHPI